MAAVSKSSVNRFVWAVTARHVIVIASPRTAMDFVAGVIKIGLWVEENVGKNAI